MIIRDGYKCVSQGVLLLQFLSPVFPPAARALESGLTCRRAQMMPKRRDPKAVMRYDYGRESFEQNAVNFLGHDEE